MTFALIVIGISLFMILLGAFCSRGGSQKTSLRGFAIALTVLFSLGANTQASIFTNALHALHLTNVTTTCDGSQADCQSKASAAHDGDTVMIGTAPGSFTWTSNVNVSKAIKIQGLGSGRVIGDTLSNVTVGTGSKTFTTRRPLPNVHAGDTLRIAKMTDSNKVGRDNFMEGTVTSYSGTTLVMNITNTGESGTYHFWFISTPPTTTVTVSGGDLNVTQSAAGNTEISGIHFVVSATNPVNPIEIGGATLFLPKTIVHDCWFQNGPVDQNTGKGTRAIKLSTNQALVYECSFDGNNFLNTCAIQMSYQNDENTWRTPSTMGMDDVNGATNSYIEDCDFRGYLNISDFDNSSRAVVRHCLLDNSGMGTHGADSSPIGQRHLEIYDNELIFDNFGDPNSSDPEIANMNWFVWFRGGTGVVTDNILPKIQSRTWGSKSNVYFSVLNLKRPGGCYSCWHPVLSPSPNPHPGYPAPHQVGQGFAVTNPPLPLNLQSCNQIGDANYYIYSEPIYVWNNTGTAGDATGLNVDGADDPCGNGQRVQDYVQAGRDYIIGAKPGYVKFTYPHPLRGGRPSPTPTATPSPSPSSTPTATATATTTQTPSATPTATASASPTATQSPTATATSTPAPTATATPTATAIPTATPAPTPTPLTATIILPPGVNLIVITPTPANSVRTKLRP